MDSKCIWFLHYALGYITDYIINAAYHQMSETDHYIIFGVYVMDSHDSYHYCSLGFYVTTVLIRWIILGTR